MKVEQRLKIKQMHSFATIIFIWFVTYTQAGTLIQNDDKIYDTTNSSPFKKYTT